MYKTTNTEGLLTLKRELFILTNMPLNRYFTSQVTSAEKASQNLNTYPNRLITKKAFD